MKKKICCHFKSIVVKKTRILARGFSRDTILKNIPFQGGGGRNRDGRKNVINRIFL